VISLPTLAKSRANADIKGLCRDRVEIVWRSRGDSPPLHLVAGWRELAGRVWHDRGMTVVKINAITVPADGGDELARRFAARAGAVDDQAGFEGFELLKPTDDRSVWLVVTRWRDEESFQAWVNSPAFAHGHRSAAERAGGEAPQRPVGVHSELWSYEIAGGSRGADGSA
jgi:heme oxygenase (mycobilin-producing)